MKSEPSIGIPPRVTEITATDMHMVESYDRRAEGAQQGAARGAREGGKAEGAVSQSSNCRDR